MNPLIRWHLRRPDDWGTVAATAVGVFIGSAVLTGVSLSLEGPLLTDIIQLPGRPLFITWPWPLWAVGQLGWVLAVTSCLLAVEVAARYTRPSFVEVTPLTGLQIRVGEVVGVLVTLRPVLAALIGLIPAMLGQRLNLYIREAPPTDAVITGLLLIAVIAGLWGFALMGAVLGRRSMWWGVAIFTLIIMGDVFLLDGVLSPGFLDLPAYTYVPPPEGRVIKALAFTLTPYLLAGLGLLID